MCGNNCYWIIILILLFSCCGNGSMFANNGGCGCGNSCDNGGSCGCGC